MFLLNTVALSIINGEGVPVEVIRQLLEKCVGELLVLQHAEETQFRHARPKGGRGRGLGNEFLPCRAASGDSLEVLRNKNLPVFEVAHENGPPNQRVQVVKAGWLSSRQRYRRQLMSDGFEVPDQGMAARFSESRNRASPKTIPVSIRSR